MNQAGAIRILAGILVAAFGIAFCRVAQLEIDDMRDDELDEELLYLPSEKLLNHFTVGMSSIIADLLWLRTIQYASKEFKSVDRKFTWLEQMCQMVTQLDPQFTGAYTYGGMLMAAAAIGDAHVL